MRSEIPAGPLVLRQYEPAFAHLLCEAAQASYSPEFAQYAPWCHAAYALADSEKFVAQCMADWLTGSAYLFALFDVETSEFCGGIGLNQPNRAHGFYNLGYWVRPSRQRQGLARQAVRHLAQAAFADLPSLSRLEILTLPGNLPSQRTALAAGATYEGLLRQRLRIGPTQHDALLYSLVKADVVEKTVSVTPDAATVTPDSASLTPDAASVTPDY